MKQLLILSMLFLAACAEESNHQSFENMRLVYEEEVPPETVIEVVEVIKEPQIIEVHNNITIEEVTVVVPRFCHTHSRRFFKRYNRYKAVVNCLDILDGGPKHGQN